VKFEPGSIPGFFCAARRSGVPASALSEHPQPRFVAQNGVVSSVQQWHIGAQPLQRVVVLASGAQAAAPGETINVQTDARRPF